MTDAVTQIRPVRQYGYYPDLADARDRYVKKSGFFSTMFLPSVADLTPGMPPCYDQGQTNSCTGNSIAGVIEYLTMKANGTIPPTQPSRLFIYYGERDLEGDVDSDGGAMIRDGITVVSKTGVCPETMWPFDASKLTLAPPAACYAAASKLRVASYARVDQTVYSMRSQIAKGLPIIIGVTLYDSFESDAVAATGQLQMPNLATEKPIGGHAMGIVGYNHPARTFRVRNSWGCAQPAFGQPGYVPGSGWGINGSGYLDMPYDYLTNPNLCTDLWVIESLTSA